MGDKITLTLDERHVQGKKVASLRKDGLVPGVVYGQGVEPILVQGGYQLVEKVVHTAGRHTPVAVTIGKKQKLVMIKDIDRDPVKARIRHISLHAVKANETVTAEVPLHLESIGDSPAEKAGLVILQAIESIEVKAKPADLPEALIVPVVTLSEEGEKVTLADITLPGGVEYADVDQNLELAVASVYEPAALQAANEAAGGDAEPEDAEDVAADNGEAAESAESNE